MSMLNLFRRNKPPPDKLLKDIAARLERLEKGLESVSGRTAEYRVTIENVNVHHPVLENLTFKLDSLNIQELSGALNLGNNFSPKVGSLDPAPEKKNTPPVRREPAEPPLSPPVRRKNAPGGSGNAAGKPDTNERGLEGTQTGFRMKL
ncbi:hypothetical protein MJA45_20375 [Paenibacillus aurantius]|uniref:Uncharacterized protein n=1 Tax=Paenibacillus aurantius TaxID=2918900 RepID=A0AA96RGE6_9BACL|nr:hypothetical protein [Paenibacillus aurantius]WNQ09959.1 hypothetical protein MJA45_20375 [Paenibacillus aurantius]